MITTVTTTTTTILDTTFAASLTLIVVLAFIALLVQREVLGGFRGERARQVRQALNIAIMPLGLVFCITVIVKLIDMAH